MSYVYGPVPSRRLGRSLGIDLIPFKTCTYDCTYCQLGPTTCKTVARRHWAPLDDVEAAVRDKLSFNPDYITISGSGEPTLHRGIGALIDRLRSITNIPVAVLTNGSLLSDREVQDALSGASLVMPSLDAGNPRSFASVNQPHASLEFARVLEGLVQFRAMYDGAFWLEVLLLRGVTDSALELYDLQRCIRRIAPDRVQLNTVARPPGSAAARAVPRETLFRIAGLFDPPAEVIAAFHDDHVHGAYATTSDDLLALLERRPCTLEDLAGGLGLDVLEVVKHLEDLTRKRQVTLERVGSKVFYHPCAIRPRFGAGA